MRLVLPVAHFGAAVVVLAGVLVSAGSASAGRGETELVFSRTDPDQGVRSVTLICRPDGGSHPDAAGACGYLAAGGGLGLPEENAEVRCFRYYPVELRVEGTLRGHDISISNTYGCLVPELATPWKF
ncbi:SSI family serine proteinase inhibitor [Nocardia pseudobrasiliensis]|uniref:Subtilisin inhibitor-like n=1 Tax=Nocardia pseudobrasiliensis TaxID=45979 RepID=A0A370I154_9NOCA|nr:subtilisin inhibitor-like [Nocardia pseudobrasiliensis]